MVNSRYGISCQRLKIMRLLLRRELIASMAYSSAFKNVVSFGLYKGLKVNPPKLRTSPLRLRLSINTTHFTAMFHVTIMF